MLLFWVQAGSAATGIVAAALWFRSAAAKTPPRRITGPAVANPRIRA
jgi:hypothetical protein